MLKKYFSLLAVFISLLSLVTDATAFAGSQTGQITKIIVRSSDGLIYFYLSGQLNSPASCAVGGY